MTVKEKFLRYVQVETTSEATCETCPSSPNQLVLANMLVDELKAMGIANARVDEHGYVYATIPAKGDHPAKVGLIAHMDTSDGVRGATKPVCIPNYDGKPVTLANGVVIDGFDFLPTLAGQELIVTSGDSVLGADDKAGVAEIMALAQRLMAPDAPEHCTVCIGFTPDEEIGRGADLFDVPGFGADYAYTVDGGALGELEYENFNAASCLVTVNGVNIHPGSAKNQMKNALLLGIEWNGMLPPAERATRASTTSCTWRATRRRPPWPTSSATMTRRSSTSARRPCCASPITSTPSTARAPSSARFATATATCARSWSPACTSSTRRRRPSAPAA